MPTKPAGFLGCLATIVVLAATPGVAGQEVPDLLGVWSGVVEAGVSEGLQHHEPEVVEPTFGNYDLAFTLTVDEQRDRAIVGTWSSVGHSEQIFGVIRQDNRSLMLVDEDSYFDALVLSPTTMELCLAETHDEAMGVWCLRMTKQEP